MKEYDCAIVGGGPAGMTAALYLLRSGVKLAWAEKLSPGGQVLLTETVDNYPGFPKGIKGYELADLFRAHLDEFEFDKYNDQVMTIRHDPAGNEIQVGDEWIKARTVIISTGAEFKKLGLDREEELLGKGVSYCAMCDGNFFRGAEVAVVGGGDSALEESLYLSKVVKKVHLVHRRNEFRGAQIYRDKVARADNIEILYNNVVIEILGQDAVEGVKLRNTVNGSESTLDVEGLFIFIGHSPVTGFYPKGLDVDEWNFIKTDAEMRSNLPGVFAAGDIRSKLCRQVATAVGDGATAAHAAFLYLEQMNG